MIIKVIARKLNDKLLSFLSVQQRLDFAKEEIMDTRQKVKDRISKLNKEKIKMSKKIEKMNTIDMQDKDKLVANANNLYSRLEEAVEQLTEKLNKLDERLKHFNNKATELLIRHDLAETQKEIQELFTDKKSTNDFKNIVSDLEQEISDIEIEIESTNELIDKGIIKEW